MNNSDPPSAIPKDQCVLAQNVTFERSLLGERRRGCEGIDLTGSPFTNCERIVWVHRHVPSTTLSDAQLWVLGIDDTGPAAVLAYKTTVWNTVTMADALTIDGVSEYQIEGVSLHGKLFIAYNSTVDILHVWDGTSLRRTGLPQPAAAPTGANDGGVGTFIGTRYYRVREAIQAAGTTTIRSEPSATLTFAPNGNDTGIVVTKPALSASATHWELEASLDDANFYRIATTAVATATVTDTTAFATGYEAYTLSEDVGDYTRLWSARYLATDDDRLILAGSFEDANLSGRVGWTPVGKATGIANDERMELDTDPFVDLDTKNGGGLTVLTAAIQGYLYAFKWGHVYQGVRSGLRSAAYKFYQLTDERGAVPGSAVNAVDQNGAAVLYVLDPAVGPTRIGSRGGLQGCGADLLTTWRDSVNTAATKVIARGVYDSITRQVQWCVATSGSNVPNYGLVLQTNEMQDTADTGARRGWAIWTGPRTQALTMCLFSDNIDAGIARNNSLRPFIGVEGGSKILRCDVGDDDDGTEYIARIVSAPLAGSILHQTEVKAGALLAKAVTGASIDVILSRDFGLETKTVSAVAFDATGSETQVVKDLDSLTISEFHTLQVEFVDVATPGARWELNEFAMRAEPGQGA
jgi:hypothetical protein